MEYNNSPLYLFTIEAIKANIRLCCADTSINNMKSLAGCYELFQHNIDNFCPHEANQIENYYRSQIGKIAEMHENYASGVRKQLNIEK